jgi:T-complex protein 11
MVATLFATPGACVLPRSFQFDLKRLERLRTDMQDLIHLKMGLVVFDELRFWLAPRQPVSLYTNGYIELQSRLLAIVDEQPDDGDPWQTSLADVSLEITRAACTFCGHSEVAIPDCLIQSTFLRLNELLSGQTPESTLIWESLQEQLTSRTIHHAQVFNEMTPLAVSEAQQQWQQQQEQKTTFRPLPDVEDIARRLAHVGILHWKIWANLVYLDDAEDASSELLSMISLPSNTQMMDHTAMISDALNSVGMMVE